MFVSLLFYGAHEMKCGNKCMKWYTFSQISLHSQPTHFQFYLIYHLPGLGNKGKENKYGTYRIYKQRK